MTSPNVDLELAQVHGLSEDEYQSLVDGLGRTPTYEELGIISVMWSEHCSYKSSRKHLPRLPTEAPWVLQGPGENAGIIDVGDGQAVAFKMESHNHPSFIEPYQGAATGVGGIMRDVFTMGARPIASLNSLRFGSPDNPRTRFLVEGVVAGIGGYGNCMGVPTVGGEIAFDSSYDGNNLVNAFTLGVLRTDRIFRSAAAGIGNDVIYVGSKTGRDGIHGATMASEEFGEDSEAKRPRVQVGDPFTEKTLLEACLELMAADVIVAIQDMGAAGLTSSSCEMASKGGLGIELNVDEVPRRETGMTPYEVLLSESQERMLMVVRDGGAEVVRRIFDMWSLDSAVRGTITDTKRIVVKDAGVVVADLPVDLIDEAAPAYDRPAAPPDDLEARWVIPELPERDAGERLLALMARPTIASKQWVWEQYDHSVRCGTVVAPGAADAAVIRLPGLDSAPSASNVRGVALTVDMNGRYCALDPYRGALLGVLEAARNLACVGATPRGTTDCLNFGNPEKSDVMWTFTQGIDGLAAGCRAMDAPIVSGNVSFYNETDGQPILPTPTIAMVGVVDDVRNAGTMAFADDGDAVILLGRVDERSLAGSELLLMETDQLAGRPDEPDLELAKAVHATCREAVASGVAKSAHDAAEGGVAAALAECCIAGEVGATVTLPVDADRVRAAFGEGPSVIVLTAAADRVEDIKAIAAGAGCPAVVIGRVGGDRLTVEELLDVPVSALSDAWTHGLTRALGMKESS